jgi:hypothetical protein
MAYTDTDGQRAVLGGMKAVIADPSRDDSLGAQLIHATATLAFEQALLGAVNDVPTTPPDRLAAVLTSDEQARSAAEMIAVAALVDGALEATRLKAALDYAAQLRVDGPWVDELLLIADGRMDDAMQLMVLVNAETFPGLAPPGLAPVMQPYDGKSDADKRLHARYESLEGYPDESFGRRLWVHFRRHGFRWPGQEGAFAETFAIRHDSIHVLSDYDTSIQGELLVSTFTGRMHRRHALGAHLLPVIVQWHVGQEVNGIGAQHGALDPWKFIVAGQRGTQTSTDVLAPGWSFFEEAQRPLDDLRRDYGIPPLPQQFRASGPEVNVTAEADPTVH